MSYDNSFCFVLQVADINGKIKAAGRESPLYKLPLLEDPSNEIAEVLVKSVEWNMLSREWNLSVSDLSELHKLSKGLLEALNTHLPDRVGGGKGGTLRGHIVSCTKFMKLSCGVGQKTLHVKDLSMLISI